jgi:mannosyl-glycoprotein endo-beta-N-acetylglucosaminidase
MLLKPPGSPLTLVCHDCGSTVYKEDAASGKVFAHSSEVVGEGESGRITRSVFEVNAVGGAVEVGHCYRLIDWSVIDVFVYFSHARVTVPPRGWIEAAHKHGCIILGTVITEWEDGERENRLLCDPGQGPILADALGELAGCLGFDGWLVNVEAALPNGKESSDNLLKFLSSLRLATKKSAADSSSSCVIWYDSIDVDSGKVKHACEISDKNRVFLDACDAVFLDYHWAHAGLLRSVAATPPGRARDVFVGLDVWGRGMIGDGGWNSVEAVRLIPTELSLALFAPAWTYENQGGQDSAAQFWDLERRFWSSLWSGRMPAQTSYFSELPFSSSFEDGVGAFSFRRGQKLPLPPWTCLGLQSPLPPSLMRQNEEGTLSVEHSDAWTGGASLHVASKVPRRTSGLVVPLFPSFVPVNEGQSVEVAVIVKRLGTSTHSSIALELVLYSGKVVKPDRVDETALERGWHQLGFSFKIPPGLKSLRGANGAVSDYLVHSFLKLQASDAGKDVGCLIGNFEMK